MPADSARHRRIGDLTRTRRQEGRERGWDADIGRLAEGQHGVVAWRQLRELRLGKDAIQHRIAAGRLLPVHRGVYAVGHRLIHREGHWMAAVLASGPEAILSHWSAAALWGLRPSSRTRIDVTVPHRSRSSDLLSRHVSEVPPDERAIENRIPVTSVSRTILDMAATEPLVVVRGLLREMEFRELWDLLSLWDLVERYPGRRGIRKVVAALEALRDEPGGERKSYLEERFGTLCRRHRLPPPLFNQWILAGSKRLQVDCHWPGTSHIVELDGWQAHKTRTAFREDRARDRTLQVYGYSVIHLTWNQLEDEPEAVASDLRALLRRKV